MLEMYEFTYLTYLDLTEKVEIIPRTLSYWETVCPEKVFGHWDHPWWGRPQHFRFFFRASKRWRRRVVRYEKAHTELGDRKIFIHQEW
jgi:hypothetical protein